MIEQHPHQRAPEAVFDVRRFRPNIDLADTAVGADFPETEWAGRRIAIGEAVFDRLESTST